MMRSLADLAALLVGVSVLLAACAPANPASPRAIPVPPTARRESIEGAYEIKIDLVGSAVLRELQAKYGRASTEVYFLADETDWSSIDGFYTQTLGSTGWDRDRSFVTEHRDYRLAVWSAGGWLSKKAIAIAYVHDASPAPGGSDKFLLVFLTGG